MTRKNLLIASCIVFLVCVGIQYRDYVPLSTGTPVKAVIVTETSLQSTLDKNMVDVLQLAPSLGVLVLDKDDKGPDKKTPPKDLAPFLKAAMGKELPQLVRQWKNNRITSVACPKTIKDLRKAVKPNE